MLQDHGMYTVLIICGVDDLRGTKKGLDVLNDLQVDSDF